MPVITPIEVDAEVKQYTLVSDDIYVRRYDASNIPAWYENMVNTIIARSGTIGNINDLIAYLNGLPAGYNMQLFNMNNGITAMNASLESLVTRDAEKTAAITTLNMTKVDALSAQAISDFTVAAYFNDGHAGAWFDTKISAYASAIEASASNVSTLAASLNGQQVTIATMDSVLMTTKGWAASASKLVKAPDGSITGWSFADGSNIESDFSIYANNFKISDGTTGYTPFSIVGSKIAFNGTVSFTNVTDTASIPTIASVLAAQATADAAASTASNAVTTANGANTLANTAYNNASTAYTTATTAVQNATLAQNAAVAAQLTANSKILASEAAAAINGNTVTVNGGMITAGTITLERLASSTSGNAISGGTFGLGAGANVAGWGGIGAFESNSASKFGIVATNNAGQLAIACGSSTSQYALGAYNSISSTYSAHNTAAFLASSADAGYFTNNGSGKQIWLATGTYAYVTAGGASGSFTGGHDAFLPNAIVPTQGDILEITGIASKKYFYDTSPKVAIMSTAYSPAVYGVFAEMIDVSHLYPSICNADGTIDLEYSELLSTHTGCIVNAVGEGQINVCGLGGNISIGDYICSSSIPGKGMKQNDTILHNYTVAKAMEAVVFDTPEQVKMIACTYHCG